MEACDLEENPQVFRQKTAPGPSGTLRDVQSSISSGVKPLLTSDCFDSSRFLSHVPSYRKRVSTRQNQNKHSLLLVHLDENLPKTLLNSTTLFLHFYYEVFLKAHQRSSCSTCMMLKSIWAHPINIKKAQPMVDLEQLCKKINSNPLAPSADYWVTSCLYTDLAFRRISK